MAKPDEPLMTEIKGAREEQMGAVSFGNKYQDLLIRGVQKLGRTPEQQRPLRR